MMRTKLKKMRLEKKLTQQQIADKAGIHRTTYTNIELGTKDPSFKVARSIKDILGTNDDDIFLNKNVDEGNNQNCA